MLSAEIRINHFEDFLLECKQSANVLTNHLHQLLDDSSHVSMVELENTDKYKEFMEACENFAGLIVNGEHDITAKFWLTYCSLVELYQLFSRSVRTNDLNLFIYSLEKMIPLFSQPVTIIMPIG